MDLMNSANAYFFGFAQCDGHLSKSTRNRGKLSIEIRESDIGILEEFQKIINVNSTISKRIRDTNFKNDSRSACLTVYNFNFRETLNKLGILYGPKSNIISKPSIISDIDYFRGVIDANGSLGLTGKGFPFISLVIASESLKNDYVNFLKNNFDIDTNIQRNTRDAVYNIMISKEKAQLIVNELYYENCLCLDRKREKARDVTNWVRPANMKKINAKNWSNEEVLYIQNNTIEESSINLNRSTHSIKMKLWRLNKYKNKKKYISPIKRIPLDNYELNT